MWSDLRVTGRMLRRTPVFTAVAVLSLALGIGANTAIFSLLDQAILRPLPFRDPARLIVFDAGPLHLPGGNSSDNHATVFSTEMYRELARRTDLFAGAIARTGLPSVVMNTGTPEFIQPELVSGNYFDVLGVRAMLGRTLTVSDDGAPGSNPVAVLSFGTWKTRFGGDPQVVNRTVKLNGLPFTIVGVLSPSYASVTRGKLPGIIVPLSMQPQIFAQADLLRNPRMRWINVIARLQDTASRMAAEDAIQSTWRGILDRELRNAQPQTQEEFRNNRLRLLPGERGISMYKGQWETTLVVLMLTAGLVLLIACLNLAGLMVARAAGRERESAIRLSLGAGTLRIVRQPFIETLLLCSAGAVAGILLAGWVFDALMHYSSLSEGVLEWRIDARVLVFTAVVSLAASVLSGILPAFQAARNDIAGTLKRQAATVAGRGVSVRARKLLAGLQVTLATALLICAGLFAQTLWNLVHVDPGFRAEGVVTFGIDPAAAGHSGTQANHMYSEITRRLTQTPGIVAAGSARPGPFSGSSSGGSIRVEGYQPPPNQEPDASNGLSGPGFFRALGIPLIAGRDFTEADKLGAPRVGIVNETFARRYLRGEPLGRHFGFNTGAVPNIEIVGVVANMKSGSLREPEKPAVYTPYAQSERPGGLMYYVRTGPEANAGAMIRSIVASVAADTPIYRIEPLADSLERSVSAERLIAVLTMSFGAVAALLAALGVYGIVAWTVTRRTNEIAVRVALGAMPGGVLELILRETLTISAIASIAGAALALAAARFAEDTLFGVAARDPFIFASATICTLAVAAASALIPAWRALRIDPAIALRSE